jgi:ubiquinone/menaquinone biosynthesis C-methylase UbiE
MAETSLSFSGSIPQMYDRYLGPVLFEPYAVDLARRVAAHAAGPVLEMACGTGVVTQQLRTYLKPAIKIVATDLSQPMLDYARAKLTMLANVDWRQADIAALPFPDASFSTVTCQFGLMFVSDKQAAFREARRVLRRDGVFAFNVWDAMSANPYALLAHETLTKLFPVDPPQFFTVPFSFHDHDVLRQLLTTHDFSDVQIETVTLETRSESATALATGFIQGSPLSTALQERGAAFEPVVGTLAEAFARLGGAAPFRSSMQAVVVLARAGAVS